MIYDSSVGLKLQELGVMVVINQLATSGHHIVGTKNSLIPLFKINIPCVAGSFHMIGITSGCINGCYIHKI